MSHFVVPSPHSCPPRSIAADDPLIDLARHLVAAAHHSGIDGVLVVGIERTELRLDAVAVHFLGDSPDRLRGWLAPVGWHGCALIGPSAAPPSAPPTSATHVAVVSDHRALPMVVQVSGEAQRARPGTTADVVLRILGVPTPAAPCTVVGLATAIWVHRIFTVAANHRSPQTLSASDLAGHHPIFTHPAMQSWRDLARTVDDHDLRLTPRHRRWLDNGSYCRAILDRIGDHRVLLADLSPLLSPKTLETVNRIAAIADLWPARGANECG